MPFSTSPGSPTPYGVKIGPSSVNFSVFVDGTPPVELVLFNPTSGEEIESIEIPYQTGQVKHIALEGLNLPIAYGYRLTKEDGTKQLLHDPFARLLLTPYKWERREKYQPLGLIVQSTPFDWKNTKRPLIPREELIIYEMHVRGFTKDPSSRVKAPGTFKGVIEKIPHLKDLGINAVELLPMFEFNESDYLNPEHPDLLQYWGYSTVNFFFPMNRYASSDQLGAVISEFKEMVRELHKAGIAVILDVVFNHTAEGNDQGPALSFKGLANSTYYILTEDGKQTNYSGCGNTFNCNNPIVIDFIIDSLRYWVIEMQVDGFRFDLASIFYRGEKGEPLSVPPLLQAINKDPVLVGTKLIAEPWDAAGLYHVGEFFPESPRFSEWNGKYRDCIRRFIKGDGNNKGEFAGRITGSEDLYGHHYRSPKNSINYTVCHDGFNLTDLVSYNQKHNEINGEGNRDGMNENDSWNCGVEGATDNQDIIRLREKQKRNMHLALMVSQGIPMVFMGDEYGHTKNGNNNTWCQDNRLNWFLWDEFEKNHDFYRFYKGLIHFRKNHNQLKHRKFLREDDIQWHGIKPFEPIWDQSHPFIAFTLIDKNQGQDLYIAFNPHGEKVEVTLPPNPAGRSWRVIANTALPSPKDFNFDASVRITGKTYPIESYSSILLKRY